MNGYLLLVPGKANLGEGSCHTERRTPALLPQTASSSKHKHRRTHTRTLMTITLTQDPNTITITSTVVPNQQLVIDRKSFSIKKTAATAATASSTSTYAALLGAIRLLSGHYLVLVKSSQSCTSTDGEFLHHNDSATGTDVRHQVQQCTEIELKPLLAEQQLQTLPSAEQQNDERQYLELLLDELFNKEPRSFYYSDSYDLSCSLQSYFDKHSKQQLSQPPSWDLVDDQFVWNMHLAKPFIEAGCSQWISPVIRGCT